MPWDDATRFDDLLYGPGAGPPGLPGGSKGVAWEEAAQTWETAGRRIESGPTGKRGPPPASSFGVPSGVGKGRGAQSDTSHGDVSANLGFTSIGGSEPSCEIHGLSRTSV